MSITANTRRAGIFYLLRSIGLRGAGRSRIALGFWLCGLVILKRLRIVMRSLWSWLRKIRISIFWNIRFWGLRVRLWATRLPLWRILRRRNISKSGRMSWRGCTMRRGWRRSVWRSATTWFCGSVRGGMCIRRWSWKCSISRWLRCSRRSMTHVREPLRSPALQNGILRRRRRFRWRKWSAGRLRSEKRCLGGWRRRLFGQIRRR